MDPIQQGLADLQAGDRSAIDRLLPLVYQDLRAIAGALFRSQDHHTLQPTALVHEAYMRLVRAPDTDWKTLKHFMNVAAVAMRQLLADHARARGTAKRGGQHEQVLLEADSLVLGGEDGVEVVDLEAALAQLEELDARQARLVELRFFTGLTVDEAADVLGISPRTARLDWAMARSFLRECLDATDGP